MNPLVALQLLNSNLEKQNYFPQTEKFSQNSTGVYHKKVIKLRPRVSYDIVGFKKIKLNSQLSYVCVQTPKVTDSSVDAKIEEVSESAQSEEFLVPTQVIRSRVLQARKKSSNQCGYRMCQQFSSNNYDNLKKILTMNSAEIQQLKCPEKSEFMQLFMQFYDPTLFLIDVNSLPSIQNRQLNAQISKEPDNKIQCSKPRFSFRDSVSIRFKEMCDDQQLRVKKALKNLFYLYLNGDYRGINDSFSLKDAESENWEKTISNRYVSYKYKSKHINFDYCPKKSEENSNESPIRKDNEDLFEGSNLNNISKSKKNEKEGADKGENNKKQVIYNKSKYVMQFLLKLLDKEHLDFLMIPEGFQKKIETIQENIKETSKRNKLSQSQFYNHTHFDCLFLQITSINEHYIQSSDELLNMHCGVFEVADLVDSFTINSINFFKELITQIIMQQIDLIRTQIIPQLAVHTLSFKSSSKLKYFERICDSIEKLKEGYIISKF